MEVTALNFEAMFPRIIDSYLRCSIIAIDCEFSGVRAQDTDDIPTLTTSSGDIKLQSSPIGSEPDRSEKQFGRALVPREQAYSGLQSAAQKYTVFQLGLTFAWAVKDHNGSDVFKTETYSFLVNPFLDSSTGEGAKICRVIERDVTVNSASVHFLQSTRFDFHALFRDGLRYLTFAEENKIKEYVNSVPRRRVQRTERGTEQQAEDDREDERVRTAIGVWLAHAGSTPGERLQLFPLDGKPMLRPWISRVHSIVKEEFEDCFSWKDFRDDCIIVKHVDRAAEADRQAEKAEKMKASIRRGIGLRNVIGLILGNDLSEQVIPEEFAEAQVKAADRNDWGTRLEADRDIERVEATRTLSEKLEQLREPRSPPMLVGHNLGWDIAFLSEAFLEPLPDTLAEFVRMVGGMFPRLFDTRIVAANHSDALKDLDLYAIHATLLSEGVSSNCHWAPGMGYRTDSAHDAGYDSFVTAKVFLMMGRRLAIERSEGSRDCTPSQLSINREVVDWDSPIWDGVRGKFMVRGHVARVILSH